MAKLKLNPKYAKITDLRIEGGLDFGGFEGPADGAADDSAARDIKFERSFLSIGTDTTATYFSCNPFVDLTGETATRKDLQKLVIEAMKRPAPLLSGFRGFKNLQITEIFAQIFTDLAMMQIALNRDKEAAKTSDDDDFKANYRHACHVCCAQSAYLMFIAQYCEIYIAIEQSKEWITAVVRTGKKAADDGCMRAFDDVSQRFADYFFYTLIEAGAYSLCEPIKTGAALSSALCMLEDIEGVYYFAHKRCIETDSADVKRNCLAAAQAAYLIRETAFKWLFKGVMGIEFKPAHSDMIIPNRKKLDKAKIKELDQLVIGAITQFSFPQQLHALIRFATGLFDSTIDSKISIYPMGNNTETFGEAK